MVKVACYGEMHSTVGNFFAKVLFISECFCEILVYNLGSNSYGGSLHMVALLSATSSFYAFRLLLDFSNSILHS